MTEWSKEYELPGDFLLEEFENAWEGEPHNCQSITDYVRWQDMASDMIVNGMMEIDVRDNGKVRCRVDQLVTPLFAN